MSGHGLFECRFCGGEYAPQNELAEDHEEGCYVRESYERYPALWPEKVPEKFKRLRGFIQ